MGGDGITFPGSDVLMRVLGVEVKNMKPKRMKHNSSEKPHSNITLLPEN